MELKFGLQKSDKGEKDVLIAPLWNWNYVDAVNLQPADKF